MTRTGSPGLESSTLRRFSIRLRLLAGFALLILLLGGTMLGSFVSLGKLRAAKDEISARQVPELSALLDIAVTAKAAANDERGFLLAGDQEFADEFDGLWPGSTRTWRPSRPWPNRRNGPLSRRSGPTSRPGGTPCGPSSCASGPTRPEPDRSP